MRRLALSALMIAFAASACIGVADSPDPRTSTPGQISIEVGPGTEGDAIYAALAAGEAVRDYRDRHGEYPRTPEAAVDVIASDPAILGDPRVMADHRLAGYQRAEHGSDYTSVTLCVEMKDEDGPWAVYDSHVDSIIASGESGGCPSHWS